MTRRPRPQEHSPSYRLAFADTDFMKSPAMRGVRLQIEFTKADEALRAAGIRSTVVVFGSARVRDGAAGDAGRWYAEARRFGRIVSERGGALREEGGGRDNVIATGGGGGIMEAACRGAHDAGAPAVGFNIRLPAAQPPNAFTTPGLTFQFHYFAIRKLHLAMRARALVVFPGGFGTFDELFELLTLRQTGRLAPVPIVLVDERFWRGAVNWRLLADEGMIGEKDLALPRFAADAEAAWRLLDEAGVGKVG